jgi:hypothetical protein
VKKRSTISAKSITQRRPRPKFPHISEEMKQWSASLQSELNSWSGITTKSMFGFLFYFRRGIPFAALPRTRGFDSPSSILFKFDPLPSALRDRAHNDLRMQESAKATSKGWFAFELSSESDLHPALFWLNQAYERAKKKTPQESGKR